MLSSTAFLYFSWASSFRNFQVRLFGGGLCYFLICVLKIISRTSSLCWVTHSSFPITFTFWTCFRSLRLIILSSERNQEAVGFWKLSFSLLQPFFKYYHSNATRKAHLFNSELSFFANPWIFVKKIERSVFVLLKYFRIFRTFFFRVFLDVEWNEGNLTNICQLWESIFPWWKINTCNFM